MAPTTLVLDGEVAIFDEQLRSRFELLRAPATAGDLVHTPPMYIAFDVLYAAGADVTGRPLSERRAQLEDLVGGADVVLPVRRLAPHGLEAWAQVLERGYEGYVGKDVLSLYRGGVTRSWLKAKVPGWAVEGDQWTRAKL
jgi:bifunctional non-homologous end joining protein LigD